MNFPVIQGTWSEGSCSTGLGWWAPSPERHWGFVTGEASSALVPWIAHPSHVFVPLASGFLSLLKNQGSACELPRPWLLSRAGVARGQFLLPHHLCFPLQELLAWAGASPELGVAAPAAME